MAARKQKFGYLTVSTVIGLLAGAVNGVLSESDTGFILCFVLGTMVGLISGIVIENLVVKFSKPIRVSFQFHRSIQHGLPQCVCQVELYGVWTPQLPNDGSCYQDFCLWSEDWRYLTLIQFVFTPSGEHEFCLCVIDVPNRSVSVSQPIAGCCTSLRWFDDRIVYSAVSPRFGAIELDETTALVQSTPVEQVTTKHPLDD